ncbi:DNA polymerase III subunit gamma/tau, partial [Paracoccus sp. PXZ]
MSEEQTYQVLARKYRPETFADLVGQDAMVRTLKNAFAADRIAQAFVMTGIRGTGKTTTARIIAKGLNCTGPDGQGGPTTEPCGVCEHCVAISEGRHVDVLEMDAASRTGVNDIREIIESVHYRAASARYKIYIIDEVHMLSTSAFNALLKTLEEPPPHVKFIFATTEIRKVPVTVLSRCQRFDLRRIEPEVMIALLRKIADREGAQITEDALALITRAAEGSARDATSLLDQAISHGAGETTATQVRAMLGLADRGRVLDLFDMILRGAAAEALAELQAQYADGADPMAVLRDLAEITHWVSIVKITPEALEDPTIGPDERARGQQIAEKVPMRALTRLWQMLLKALEEVGQAPNAMMAAEMAIIRLTHVADLPDPEALIRKVQASAAAGEFSRAAAAPAARSEAPRAAAPRAPVAVRQDGSAAALAVSPDALAGFPDFESVIELIRRMRDMKLLLDVEDHLRLVRYSPGRIEFQPTEQAPRDFAQRLAERLRGWTGGHR